jgi:hypothetical protein
LVGGIHAEQAADLVIERLRGALVRLHRSPDLVDESLTRRRHTQYPSLIK